MLEYLNPHPYELRLVGPDSQIVKIGPRSKVTLSEWFLEKYCPQYLKVVGRSDKFENPNRISMVGVGAKKLLSNPAQKPSSIIKFRTPKPTSPPVVLKPIPKVDKRIETPNNTFNTISPDKWYRTDSIIGIGILSYNRLPSIKRLLNSIYKNTNLTKVTIFVSDESSDPNVINFLKEQNKIIALTNQEQIGIAGNTNRLIRCLKNFKYGILLNDDVEILREEWENFYVNAAEKAKYHHFCFRQDGIYGANPSNYIRNNVGDIPLKTVTIKPHGAVLFFTNEVIKKVGYFDEAFGQYGMEHVDWSNRIFLSGLQPQGYHDVEGSDRFFKIHNDPSSIRNKIQIMSVSRRRFEEVKSDMSRIFVNPSDKSKIPLAPTE